MESLERIEEIFAGKLHLDGTYPSKDENGKEWVYEDWCIDMMKQLN